MYKVLLQGKYYPQAGRYPKRPVDEKGGNVTCSVTYSLKMLTRGKEYVHTYNLSKAAQIDDPVAPPIFANQFLFIYMLR